MSNLIAGNIHEITIPKNKELYSLIVIRHGGKNTVRIIDEIINEPKNANQLAKALGLDYKTVTYHLDIICEHEYFVRVKFGSNYSYFPSDKLIKNLEEYMIIKENLK
ncbi:helix-turn-helix domain-containing protein [uncultured Methanobrevibacter sp.]|uniref:helix-turn-helix domain-containing protein n=1 Tax=uncultured Methanobrevibacter sp. TaxID=253161 RepID=UPI00261BEF2E|nr:helix-turn-helix domain-containing protein [uncultured Methanobrevibacter sp.]